MIPNFDWMFNIPPNLPLMSVPDWLDESFLAKVLKSRDQDDSITVKNFHIRAVSNPGEQYMTSIFRVQVVYQSQSNIFAKHLFIKTTPCEIETFCKPIITEVFNTEIRVYSEIMGRVDQLFKDVFNESHFGPRLIYYEAGETPILVLEDLTALGFTMETRQMSLKETKLILSRLAKFHACSKAVVLEDKDLRQSAAFRKGIKMRPDIIEQLRSCFGLFVEEIQQWDGCEQYVTKLKWIMENFDSEIDKLMDTASSDESRFLCLNHGDLHHRNIMFKGNGEIKDFVIFDYQLAIWGSPAIDLICALYMIASKDTLERHRSDLVDHYKEELVAATKKLSPDTGFNVEQLNLEDELKAHKLLELMMVVCYMPFAAAMEDLKRLQLSEMKHKPSCAQDLICHLYSDPKHKTDVKRKLDELLE